MQKFTSLSLLLLSTLPFAACDLVDAEGLIDQVAKDRGEHERPVVPPKPTPPERGAIDVACEGGYQAKIGSGDDAAADTFVISLYEARSDHDYEHHPEGTVNVNVARPGLVNLHLSAHEPVLWQITAGPDTVIGKVVAEGQHPQRVRVSDAASVTTAEDVWAETCGGEFTVEPSASCLEAFWTSSARQALGPVNTYASCYRAQIVTIR